MIYNLMFFCQNHWKFDIFCEKYYSAHGTLIRDISIVFYAT